MIVKPIIKKPIYLFIPLFLGLCLADGLHPDSQKVRVDSAVVRFDPTTTSSAVATVKKGEVLDVLRVEGGWYRVTFKSE